MLLRLSLLAGVSLLASGAAAQEAEPGPQPAEAEIERPERVTTPTSALTSVLPDEALERRYLTDPLEIADTAPNMVAVRTPGFGAGNLYRLRGLGSVGTYLDGVRLSEETANLIGLFDIDEVRIVRGPSPLSAALPSAAGALDVRLRRPGTETHGEFEGYYGEFDTMALRGSLDFISADKGFGLNVSGFYQDSDGWVDNLTTGETLNEEDRWGGRAGLRFTFSPEAEWNVGIGFMRDESLNILNFECRDEQDCDDRFATTGFSAEVEDLLSPLGGLPVSGEKARNGLGAKTDVVFMSSDFVWNSAIGTLQVLASYADTDQDFAIDFGDGRLPAEIGAAPPSPAGLALGGDLRIGETSQRELTIDSSLTNELWPGIALKVGASAHGRDQDDDAARVLPTSMTASAVAYDRRTETTSDGYTVYGEVSAKLGGFDLAAGGRVGEDTVDVDLRDRILSAANVSDEFSYDVWGAFADARLALGGSAALFAHAARGFEFGGVDADRLGALGSGRIEPTANWTLEGGIEAGFWGDRVNMRLTGFYLDAEDVPVAHAEGAMRLAAQRADLTNSGAELELTAMPVDGLILTGAAGYQSASYDDSPETTAAIARCLGELAADGPSPSCGVGLVTLDGELAEPVFAPELTGRLHISYDIYIAAAESFITPSLGFDYRDAMETEAANVTLLDASGAYFGGSRADARTLVNAGLALRTDDDWWRVSVECDNCFDETYVDASQGLYGYLGRPMTWTVRARRRF